MDFTDPEIEEVYFIVRKTCCGVSVGEERREAIGFPGDLSRTGNKEAKSALQSLSRSPHLHPHLREMALAELRYYLLTGWIRNRLYPGISFLAECSYSPDTKCPK